jgi:hypothetical protein
MTKLTYYIDSLQQQGENNMGYQTILVAMRVLISLDYLDLCRGRSFS